MAGLKRGGFRGGAGGAFKKGAPKKRAASDDEEDVPRAGKKSKGGEDETSAPVIPELKEDDQGDSYISLNASGKRRVTINEFKGVPLINIREYWTNDSGDLKPGKKGISLTVEQYATLLSAAPLLEAALAKKNVQIPRPDYDADFSAAKTATEQEGGDEADEGEEEAAGKVDDEAGDEE